jgi:hypothetical protein
MATKSTIDALAKTINELIDESKPADSIVLDAGLTCFITPSTDIANAGMGADSSFQDYPLGGAVGQNGTFASITGSITNDKSYPLLLEWYVSSSMTGTIKEGNRWEFTSATGPKTDIDLSSYCVDDPLYHIEDSRQYNSGVHEFTSGKQSRKYICKLASGKKATLQEIFTLNVIDHNPNDFNTLSSGDIQIILKWNPCK